MDRDEGSHISHPVACHSVQPGWRKYVLASSGYLDLGMFDDAALALEEIEPEDKIRNEVLPSETQIRLF